MLIAFEGGEAAGKSTQARRLAERLDAVLTREPGGTAIGERIRAVLLDPASGDLDARAEALLMAADRAQHVAELIVPALAAGRIVVTDRYLYSSIAYQSAGRGLGVDEVRRLSAFAGAPEADLVVYLRIPPSARAERAGGVVPDRIEAVGDGFHERVTAGFDAQAERDPDRWAVIDGTGTVEEVAAAVWTTVAPRLGTVRG